MAMSESPRHLRSQATTRQKLNSRVVLERLDDRRADDLGPAARLLLERRSSPLATARVPLHQAGSEGIHSIHDGLTVSTSVSRRPVRSSTSLMLTGSWASWYAQ